MDKLKLYQEILLANDYVKLKDQSYEKFGYVVDNLTLRSLTPAEFANRLRKVDHLISSSLKVVIDVNRKLEAGVLAANAIFNAAGIKDNPVIQEPSDKFKEAVKLCSNKV